VLLAIIPILTCVFAGTVTSDVVYPGAALNIMEGGVTSPSVSHEEKNAKDEINRIAITKVSFFIF
jgi:hypothetical protein